VSKGILLISFLPRWKKKSNSFIRPVMIKISEERGISDPTQAQPMAILPASIKKRQRLSKTVIAVNKNEE
jgi:hypothetical protein